MIDWEDVWDTTSTIIGFIIFLTFIYFTGMFVGNSFIQTNTQTPIQYTTINNTNYTCTPTSAHIDWNWDFKWHQGHTIAYSMSIIIVLLMTMIILGMIGGIPIWGGPN